MNYISHNQNLDPFRLCCAVLSYLKSNIYWNQLIMVTMWCEDGFSMCSPSLSLSISLCLSLFCFVLNDLQDSSGHVRALFVQWFFGFTTRHDRPIKRSRDASSSLFTVRRTLLYLEIHWRLKINHLWSGSYNILNVLINHMKRGVCPNVQQSFLLEHCGLLRGFTTVYPTFFHNGYTQSTRTHAHTHNTRICQTHTHTPWQNLWIWNSISGTIFPSKRLSSWTWTINDHHLECFEIPEAWAIPKVRGHGARATPSWPHRSTTNHCWMMLDVFTRTGDSCNTQHKRGIDWGLLLGNHVNLEGGMRKCARRNKGASVLVDYFRSY